jgi:hypothetical protein
MHWRVKLLPVRFQFLEDESFVISCTLELAGIEIGCQPLPQNQQVHLENVFYCVFLLRRANLEQYSREVDILGCHR